SMSRCSSAALKACRRAAKSARGIRWTIHSPRLYGRHHVIMHFVPANDDARIDRSSPIPLYFQLARVLTEEIVKGERQPGERLASEPAIGDRFQVSRPTVRLALQRLEAEGLIERIKGRGTFIADA